MMVKRFYFFFQKPTLITFKILENEQIYYYCVNEQKPYA